MFYSLQIKDNKLKHYHQFNNWDDLCRFLVVNLIGTPESISMDIMDIFSKVSEDTKWVSVLKKGFDILGNSNEKMIVLNDDIVDMVSLIGHLDKNHRSIFTESLRNMKIDLIS
jgi:S-adenosylmethionine synthetase